MATSKTYATESELWIKISKKGSGEMSVDWNQVVEEVLCWHQEVTQ